MAAEYSNPHHLAGTNTLKDGPIVEVSPDKLNIVWGGDTRYWNVPEDGKGPAELRQVCWLEVTAQVKDAKPNKSYVVGFKISFAPDAFGWGDNYPLYFMTKRGKSGKTSWKKKIFDPTMEQQITGTIPPVVLDEKYKTEQQNKVTEDDDENVLHFGLYEVWSGKWKGGLKIHHAFAREE